MHPKVAELACGLVEARMARKAKDKGSAGIPYEKFVVPMPENDQSGAKALHVERRGIRQRVTPIMGNQTDQFVAYMRSPDRPANRFEVLKNCANEILGAAKIKPLKQVLKENAQRVSTESGVSLEKTSDIIAESWWENVLAKTGDVTPQGIAVNFLYWAYRVDRLSKMAGQESVVVALHFADAWHWLHLEISGEHVAACGGAKRQEALKSGPQRRASQKAKYTTIIEDEVRRFLSRRSSSKTPAPQRSSSRPPPPSAVYRAIVETVEGRFAEAGLASYKEDTLQRAVKAVLRTVLAG